MNVAKDREPEHATRIELRGSLGEPLGLGIVVLTNLDRNLAPRIVARGFYDRMLGLEPVPWSERLLERRAAAAARQAQAEAREIAGRRQDAPPTHPLPEYAGRYAHPGYGTLEVWAGEGGLTLVFGQFVLPLAHVHYDIFEILEIPVTSVRHLKVTFLYDKAGEIDRVAIPFEPAVPDIVFTRVAAE